MLIPKGQKLLKLSPFVGNLYITIFHYYYYFYNILKFKLRLQNFYLITIHFSRYTTLTLHCLQQTRIVHYIIAQIYQLQIS